MELFGTFRSAFGALRVRFGELSEHSPSGSERPTSTCLYSYDDFIHMPVLICAKLYDWFIDPVNFGFQRKRLNYEQINCHHFKI